MVIGLPASELVDFISACSSDWLTVSDSTRVESELFTVCVDAAELLLGGAGVLGDLFPVNCRASSSKASFGRQISVNSESGFLLSVSSGIAAGLGSDTSVFLLMNMFNELPICRLTYLPLDVSSLRP